MSFPRILGLVFAAATVWGALHVLHPGRPWGDIGIRIGGAVGVLAVGGAMAAAFWFGFAYADLPVKFRRALRQGDATAAYHLLGERAQRDFGSSTGLGRWSSEMAPQTWRFNASCGRIALGRSDGVGRYARDSRFSISVHVGKEDDRWRIIGVEWWDRSYHLMGTTSGIDCSE